MTGVADGEEAAVGIRGFLGTHRRFYGVLKHRWTDFHVHEVGLDGRILHLGELNLRSTAAEQIESKARLERGAELISPQFSICSADRHGLMFRGFFSEADLSVIENFVRILAQKSVEPISRMCHPPCCFVLGDFARCLQAMVEKAQADNVPLPTEPQVWKELRRAMHTSLREALPFLCSDTLTLRDVCMLTGSTESELKEVFTPIKPAGNTGNANDWMNRPLKLRMEEFRRVCETAVSEFGSGAQPGDPQHLPAMVQNSQVPEKIDHYRVIRLCPKPLCLRMIFPQVKHPSNFFSKEAQPGDRGTSNNCANAEDIDQQLEAKQHREMEQRERENLKGDCSVQTNEGRVKCNCGRRSKRRRKPGCPRCSLNSNKGLNSHTERWPKERPPYLFFHLWKANRDTAEAVGMIAACLGCKPRIFSVAGTKDRRAVSVQGVTAFKVSIEQLQKALLHPRWDRAVRVSDFRYQHERLTLGALRGNFFRVALRAVSPSAEAQVREACNNLRTNGFINFFGLQRFGTRAIKTHEAGAALLRGDFKRAVGLILGDIRCRQSPKRARTDTIDEHRGIDGSDKRRKLESSRGSDVVGSETTTGDRTNLLDGLVGGSSNTTQLTNHVGSAEPQPAISSVGSSSQPAISSSPLALDADSPCAFFFVTEDPAAALRSLPPHCYVERTLLMALARDPDNFLHALHQLPKNILTLHIHAAQSLIWNAVVAHRILTYGQRPVVGDFVSLPGEHVRGGSAGDTDAIDCVPNGRQNVNDGLENADRDNVFEDEDATSETFSARNVRRVESREEAESYSIFDVVCPLPGDAVEYPGFLLPTYEQLCRDTLGIELDDFRSDRSHGLGAVKGGYRHIVVLPQNLRYHFIQSVPNGSTNLLATDVDRLLGCPVVSGDPVGDEAFRPVIRANEEANNGRNVKNGLPEKDDFSDTAAVLFSCTLPKSAYLTMACRELIAESSTSLPMEPLVMAVGNGA